MVLTEFMKIKPIYHRKASYLLLIVICLLISACSLYRPQNINNICHIFEGETDWYEAAKESNTKWGTPIWVMMAIMHQESKFIDDAKPPFNWFLFIPLGRSSSAYGYAQVLDGTWTEYVKATGNRGADRDDFNDAIDFIGWYTNGTQRSLGISKWDAYNQYLAYHEGRGGYKRGSWKKKNWLVGVANKVKKKANIYNSQLKTCKKSLDKETQGWF